MLKTIKVKVEMTFRELMEYILENDIRDREFRCRQDEYKFSVCEDGIFDFYCLHYDMGEIYEVEFKEEVMEDMEFDTLVEVFGENDIFIHEFASIREIKDSTTDKIYALIDGELQLVWQRGE